MKDNITDDDIPVDPAAQKSVSDWLMQVISGRKPVELHLNGNAQAEASEQAELASKVEAADAPESAVAAEPVSVGSQPIETERPESLETAIPEPEALQNAIPVAEARREPEISESSVAAEDASREPVPEPDQIEARTSGDTEVDVSRGREPQPGPEEVETPRSEVAVEDISRGFAPEPELEEVKSPAHAITSADISRDSDFYTAGSEVSAAVAEVTSDEAGTGAIEPPESDADISHEPQPESIAAKTDAVDGPEGVFARKDFLWGPERRKPVDGDEDTYTGPERRYPVPKELQQLEGRPEGWNAAVKTLLRLGSVLPWLVRVLPMLEGNVGKDQSTGLSHEVRHEVADLRLVQYELRTAVQDQSLQLKRVEDQLTRIRQSLEPDSSQRSGLDATVKSTVKLVRLMGIGVGALLLVLIVMVAILMAHGSR